MSKNIAAISLPRNPPKCVECGDGHFYISMKTPPVGSALAGLTPIASKAVCYPVRVRAETKPERRGGRRTPLAKSLASDAR